MITTGGSRRQPGLGITVCMVCLLGCVVAAWLPPSSATAVEAATGGDERAIWELWKAQEAAPDDHTASLAVCQAFSKAHPNDPFRVVADTMGAWHLLKLDRIPEAVALLEVYAEQPDDSLEHGGRILANAWLTRIDMERIKKALQFYYRREIAYPDTLNSLAAYSALPKEMAFPMKDRGGNQWAYRLVGIRHMPGLLDQKYRLRSRMLGSGSDLAQALKVPYAERIRVRPLGVQSVVRGRAIVKIEILSTPDGSGHIKGPKRNQTVLAGVDTLTEDVLLAYAGKYLILMCDQYHWKIFPKPPPGSRT